MTSEASAKAGRAEREMAVPPRQAADRRNESPRVLLAEDDVDLRDLLAQTLRRQGYHVTECVDGRDLVSKLGTYVLFGPPAGFDVVISDVRMPGASALEIVDALRGCEALPPFVLITAFPDASTATAAGPAVAMVLEKPFAAEDLLTAVERLVARPSGDLP